MLLEVIAATCVATSTPNVVLVMTDDLGWGDPSFNDGWIDTPNLDRFAQEGLILERFYAAAPVCSPTRGSVMTGRHPSRYGIKTANSGHLPRGEHTIAEVLDAHGYATGFFGKWHLGTLTKTVKDSNRGGLRGAAHYSPPAEHGFDVVFATEAKVPTWDPMRQPAPGATTPRQGGTWWDAVPADGSAPYGTRYWDEVGAVVEDNLDGDDSHRIMDRAVPFIASAAAREVPFFAVIWFHAPHLPVVSPPAEVDVDPYVRHYRASVTGIDEAMGRLRAALDELDVAGDTLIIFCSDNGPEGNDKAPGRTGELRGRKRSLYEGGVRVPAFAWWPKAIEAGRRSDQPVVTSDLLPTIAEFIEAPLPDDLVIDGASIAPLVRGATWVRDTPIGFVHGKAESWVEPRYKLVRRTGNEPSVELYDIVADPRERNDIAKDHVDIVARMTLALDAWRANCDEDSTVR